MRKIFSVLFLCIISAFIKAEIPVLRNFTNVEYKGGTQNWCVDFSSDKRVLFANNDGLLLFDSDKWTIHSVPNYTNVRSVMTDDKNNVIYVGATNEFGYFKNDEHTLMLHYHSLSSSLPTKYYKEHGEIWKIMKAGKDVVFQSKDYLFALRPNGKIATYRFDVIDNMAQMDGRLYVSCEKGVFAYSEGGNIKHIDALDDLSKRHIIGAVKYGKDIIFATVSDGLFTYDGRTVAPFATDIKPLLTNSKIYCLAINSNTLAIGTVRNGVVLKDLQTGSNNLVNIYAGLQNNTVLSMRFDHLGNLWLGLDNGISYIMLSTPYKSLYATGNVIGTGYASLNCGDKLYLGTNQGLFVTPLPLRNTSTTPPHPTLVEGINGQVWSVSAITGKVLVGGNEGAFVIDGTHATPIDGLRGTWGFIPLRGHTDKSLGCDYNGLFVLSSGQGKPHVKNRVAGSDISSGLFMQDNDGSVWLCHWQSGVYRYEIDESLKSIEQFLYFHKSNGLPMDNENLICKIRGKVYVSSVDGFRTFDRRTSKLVKCDWLNKVFDTYGCALRVIEAPDGALWAYKPGYLAVAHRLKNGTYHAKQIPYNNMVKQLQMGLGHVGFIDSSRILLNSNNGFFSVGADNIPTIKDNSEVFIRSVVSTNEKDSLLYVSLPGQAGKRLVVPHDLNSLRIEFVMPEYCDRDGVEYSCMLENYDDQWQIPQRSVVKEYTKLARGSYVFHVKAHDIVNGKDSEASLEIIVLPAWYETWWAYFIYIILAVGVVLLVLRQLKRRAERELRKVKVENEHKLHEQQLQFKIDEEMKQKEIIRLRNDQLEIELKHKSGELADNAINLVRKNDMLQQIDTEMVELSQSVKDDATKAIISKKISDIRRNIHTHIVDDSNWDKFEENFNLVYDNFTRKLLARYDDLKKVDLKLCVYLRMGMSSKEMASLLNTSVRSIETARYRLRKKLGLESGDNLYDFIQNIGKEEEGEGS